MNKLNPDGLKCGITESAVYLQTAVGKKKEFHLTKILLKSECRIIKIIIFGLQKAIFFLIIRSYSN